MVSNASLGFKDHVPLTVYNLQVEYLNFFQKVEITKQKEPKSKSWTTP